LGDWGIGELGNWGIGELGNWVCFASQNIFTRQLITQLPNYLIQELPNHPVT